MYSIIHFSSLTSSSNHQNKADWDSMKKLETGLPFAYFHKEQTNALWIVESII